MTLSKEQRAWARSKAEEERAARLAAKRSRNAEALKKALAIQDALRNYEKKKAIHPRSPISVRVGRVAPKLLESPFFEILETLPLKTLREVRDWEPRGKGRDALFRSLMEHLYAKFPMPQFIWSAFFEKDEPSKRKLVPLVFSLASGNSFFEEVRTGGLPVPLTRKMCHDVLQSSADFQFLEAVRRVQVATVGGDSRLWKAWTKVTPGRILGTEEEENFWASVIHFLAMNPMFDRNQIGPLTDYLRFCRNETPTFSMKGRSANALFTSMLDWHGQLQRAKASAGQIFNPSGFREATYDQTRMGPKGPLVEIWRIREILTGKDLAHEGRANKHCVYSYGRSIESGRVSIWSMTREDNAGNWHAITIEVSNASKCVVQARGIQNRPTTGPEANVLQRWAEMNCLKVAGYL
jgi:hypothetical protein